MEIISGTDKVVTIEIHDPFVMGQTGFDLNMMKTIQRYNISYIMKAINANSIIFTLALNSGSLTSLPQAIIR